MVRVPRPPRAGSGGFFLLSVIFKALLLKKAMGEEQETGKEAWVPAAPSV